MLNQRKCEVVDRHVARMIKVMREAREVPAAAIAGALGISAWQYSKYENAQNRITIGRLVKILSVLKYSIDDLGLQLWRFEEESQ